jgi:hypothetical protein
MSVMVSIDIVAELHDLPKDLPDWMPPNDTTPLRVRLYGGIAREEIDRFVWSLAAYNQIHPKENLPALIDNLIQSDKFILGGGLRFTEGALTIDAGCCCGVETWREQAAALTTDGGCWLGHDPAPWVELHPGITRIWADGGLDPVPDAPYIDVPSRQAAEVEQQIASDLAAFLEALKAFTRSNELCRKLDQAWQISTPRARATTPTPADPTPL